MGEVRVDGSEAPRVQSAEEMAGRFQAELMVALPDWQRRIVDHPAGLEQLERDVHAVFARGADLLIAGLLARVMKLPDFETGAKQTRKSYRFPLRRGSQREIRVRLLGGLMIWISSLYCAPRKKEGDPTDENIPGLYLELAQFGFGKNCSPGLESRVARQAALCPSMQLAAQELARDGVKMNVKTVGRITHQCGQGLLALRRQEVLLWREGQLAAGSELHGQRVTVQIDGGRTKIRGDLRPASATKERTNDDGLVIDDAPGRSKQRPKQTYDAEWREPKLVTIFVHNDQGRMEKRSRATIDGTFQGPDALAELIAMHLHRLGAAGAASVTFVSDGACWIWDRIPVIVEKAKLQAVTIHEVLDNSHASHHVSLALAALGLDAEQRMPLYREHRTRLRNGQWRGVVEDLESFAAEDPENTSLQTEIAYLRKHGEAGRLKYPYFRQIGVPLGSGAIESSIRRVINLRLKGNGVFWREENAEAMLQVRSLVISDRWDERVAQMRAHAAYDGRTDWEWQPQLMSSKQVEPDMENTT